jgi:hypothetical protein
MGAFFMSFFYLRIAGKQEALAPCAEAKLRSGDSAPVFRRHVVRLARAQGNSMETKNEQKNINNEFNKIAHLQY